VDATLAVAGACNHKFLVREEAPSSSAQRFEGLTVKPMGTTSGHFVSPVMCF
jgi:hypothetical protein